VSVSDVTSSVFFENYSCSVVLGAEVEDPATQTRLATESWRDLDNHMERVRLTGDSVLIEQARDTLVLHFARLVDLNEAERATHGGMFRNLWNILDIVGAPTGALLRAALVKTCQRWHTASLGTVLSGDALVFSLQQSLAGLGLRGFGIDLTQNNDESRAEMLRRLLAVFGPKWLEARRRAIITLLGLCEHLTTLRVCDVDKGLFDTTTLHDGERI
jgi:hypothetical protein